MILLPLTSRFHFLLPTDDFPFRIEFFICEKCAKEKGFVELIKKSDKSEEKDKIKDVSIPEKCAFCGCKLVDIEKKGKLGCSRCYDTFRPYIKDIIVTLHGDEQHRGKVPILDKRKLLLKRKIREVKKAHDDAIKKEEYNLAASLRDRIKTLSLKMDKNE